MDRIASKLWMGLAFTLALGMAAVACNGSGSTHITCETTPCVNGSPIDLCTKADSSNSCVAMAYIVGSQSFVCNSCSDCTEAASQAAQACIAQPAGDAGGGGGGGDAAPDHDAGGGGTCAPANACGSPTSGITYQECTTLGSGGSCVSIEYRTSNGQTFACDGCSCAQAEQQLSSYCADPGSGGTVTTCSAAISCGETLSYQQCTTSTNGSCQSVAYELSNGVTYTCASCSDCSDASAEVTSYCDSESTPTTTCTTAEACGSNGVTYDSCTTTLNGACQSVDYETSDGQVYDCADCSDCSAALSDVTSYCESLSTTPTGQTCGTVTCGSAATCCNCNGTDECFTLTSDETCASFGCN